ncbi:MAG: hypothetical protein C0599_11895 [Salinivirgaceae bacterium]|nr:MAG: hypothetical protein C0599_11895 [Salinivirgaceae bacterium]
MLKINIILAFVLCFVFGTLFGQPLVINEVVFANKSGIQDFQGDTPDWIELYNAGSERINLANYCITDDSDLEDYWQFPSFEMAPGSFVLVFASAKNTIVGNEWHTNFKLRTLEESVYLLNTDLKIIDSTIIQCVPPDKSLGFAVDGDHTQREILSPTPGYSNNTAEVYEINFQPDTLITDKMGGLYENSVFVKLSNLHPGNQIYYSLNADGPDPNEMVYNGPIQMNDLTLEDLRFADIPSTDYEVGEHITKAPILRAQVYSEGCPASNELSQAYFIGNNMAEKYNVYVVSMITDKDNLFDPDEGIYVSGNHQNNLQRGKRWERPVSLEIYDKQGNKIINQKAGIRIHGRGSRMRPQKSFRLYARDEYGEAFFNYAFFSQKPQLTMFKRLLLRSAKDWGETIIKDDLTQELVRTMNVDYTASETAVLFLNGEFWGIYSLRERQDEFYVADNYGVNTPVLNVIGHTTEGVVADEGTVDNYESTMAWLNSADVHSETFYNEINDKVDLDALIDYYVAEIYLANTDFPENNLRLWRMENDTSRWRYFFYDCDACMVRARENHLADYTNGANQFQDFNNYSTYVLSKLLQNNQFNEKFRSRFLYHINQTFNPDRVLTEIKSFEQRFSPIMPEHIYRWHTPSDYNKWQMNVDGLRDFAVLRPNEMKTQILEQLGNPLEIYPNPTEGQFNINVGWGNEQYKLNIYNVLGKLIYQKSFVGLKQIQINEILKAGTYIIRLESDGIAFTGKLIVQ